MASRAISKWQVKLFGFELINVFVKSAELVATVLVWKRNKSFDKLKTFFLLSETSNMETQV